MTERPALSAPGARICEVVPELPVAVINRDRLAEAPAGIGGQPCRELSLAERFSLSHWDSMILGACQAAGVMRLYTEDMGAPRTIDGIELINPFA